MKMDSNQKYTYVFVLLVIVAGIFFLAKREPVLAPTEEPVEEVTQEVSNLEEKPAPAPSLTYRELITKGHELYLKERYTEALTYFKKAASIEQNDRIYRSLYSAYLGLKDYKNAEIAIIKSLGINNGIPNNWLEYASFEHLYLKASFDVVSKIYLDGLKATKDDINLITAYASYLTENKKYNEAISYLEKAIIIDPSRQDTFQTEIEYLRVR